MAVALQAVAPTADAALMVQLQKLAQVSYLDKGLIVQSPGVKDVC